MVQQQGVTTMAGLATGEFAVPGGADGEPQDNVFPEELM